MESTTASKPQEYSRQGLGIKKNLVYKVIVLGDCK